MAPPATPPTSAPMAAPSQPPASAPTPAPTAAPPPAPIAVRSPGVAHDASATARTATIPNRLISTLLAPDKVGAQRAGHSGGAPGQPQELVWWTDGSSQEAQDGRGAGTRRRASTRHRGRRTSPRLR